MNPPIIFPTWKQIWRSVLAIALVFFTVLGILLIGRNILGEGAITLIFLLVTGWITMRWGRLAGASAALTSGLCFDYFFIPPFYSFTIERLEGWLVLLIFVGVAVFVVGRIHVVLNEAKGREHDATFLYEMVASVANLTSRKAIANVVAGQIQEHYMAEFVRVNIYAHVKFPSVVVSAPASNSGSPNRNPDRIMAIPYTTRIVGEISFWKGKMELPEESNSMLQSFLRQTALSLERVQELEKDNNVR
jgi:K+-sensing histidine kinase KdpD